MKIVKAIKKPIEKIDAFREHLENKFADILETIDESSKVEEIEAKLLKKGLESAVAYYSAGSSSFVVPDKAYDDIVKIAMKFKHKINKKIQKQLRK